MLQGETGNGKMHSGLPHGHLVGIWTEIDTGVRRGGNVDKGEAMVEARTGPVKRWDSREAG